MSATPLFFDPDCHPDDTLKSFGEFAQDFELRYSATYPDPPKVSLESAIQRWKLTHDNKNPSVDEYDSIIDEWKSRDMVAKFLGIYSSRRFYSDWVLALPNEGERKNATWATLKTKISEFYKPTENLTLKNFQFRNLMQGADETFISFCNRVEREAKHCHFKCSSDDCLAESIAVRDQVVIGLVNEDIRQEALKMSWCLDDLRKEGMRLESAAKGASEIAGDSRVNRVLGKYSLKNSKKKDRAKELDEKASCFRCGLSGVRRDIVIHAKQCPAKTSTCSNCGKTGHLAKACKSVRSIDQETVPAQQDESSEESLYNVNIFRVASTMKDSSSKSCDFKVQVLINSSLDTVLADTGAKVSVCGLETAKHWNLLDRMVKTGVKIKPYKSKAIPAIGVSTCGVSFGDRTVPVEWHIIEESCEPILAGSKATHLGIIKFKPSPEVLMPVRMIKHEDKQMFQDVIAKYPENFDGLGCLNEYAVKLHVDPEIKPVAEPPRRIPYHLTSRVDEAVNEMIDRGVIEEHPKGEHTPWVSNLVIAPKDDGGLRITLDAKNVNKALKSSNFPIPRQEDIKAKLSGAKFFSKLDLKSAFWQLKLDKEARNMTVFHSGGKLYRYKRLVMGLKPSQGELNAALQPLFAHLPQVHVIHDDIVIATISVEEHISIVDQVMQILSKAGLTLNGSKCVFGQDKIAFWGMIFSADGVCPDPEKVKALDNLVTPTNKEELVSFLCMMQSNSDFIPGFSKKAALLRELTKKDCRFFWSEKHESCFRSLVDSFREDVLLRYFDCSLPTFIVVDGHVSGLGAMLMQGNTLQDARPVAVASRTTSVSEKHCPQLDLEATSLDFGLRRFREYVVGSPHLVKVITDHKPLIPIFNERRKGSIRTERIKINHQDVPFIVEHCKGKLNPMDYMSRHAQNLSELPLQQRKEHNELNNLLYMLHTTPVIDHIGLGEISRKTNEDAILSKLKKMLKEGKTFVDKHESPELKKFGPILSELSVTANGILFKDDRIVLPTELQHKAISLAHRGAHPGQSGIERRLRYHFFFHGMFDKVKEFVQGCEECSMFTDKKTKEPLKHHQVPKKCWETVAVDLFGPMPSSKHIVVVQDVGSRYPAAKLVSSTKADKVLPAMKEIYNEYGSPEVQISDNGPPFNSEKMRQFTSSRGIETRFSAPYFPSQNPAETFMKTIGKSMKIANHKNESEESCLQKALTSYRQNPHPSTGIPPASFLFRDGVRSHFPRKEVSQAEVEEARKLDEENKLSKQGKVNSSKYRKKSLISPGDVVIVRDCNRKSKFDPIFLSNPFVVISIDEVSKKVILEGLQSNKLLARHLDDVKEFHGALDLMPDSTTTENQADLLSRDELIAQDGIMEHYDDEILASSSSTTSDGHLGREIRMSSRTRSAPQRLIEEM